MQAIVFRLTAFCAALVFLSCIGACGFYWYQAGQFQSQIIDLPRYDDIQQVQCARDRAAGDRSACVYFGAPALSELERDRDDVALLAKIFLGAALLVPALLFALFYSVRWIATGRVQVPSNHDASPPPEIPSA